MYTYTTTIRYTPTRESKDITIIIIIIIFKTNSAHDTYIIRAHAEIIYILFTRGFMSSALI